ncbi:hypothetical protein [Paraburkholderia sp. BCC1886]|uniref:hypothetical protein n=1 Tax=Paraburkholderia sp. BCC1886 TaxID=2562670 RepID=UPI001183711B|nr:hypothetical protein [Paraburkholderia sp. BCC1886]
MLVSHFSLDDAMRSRSVSEIVLSADLDVPMPPPRLLADWTREIASNMSLEPGDVEVLPLPRARARWPDYSRCVQAVSDWTAALGLPGLLAQSDVALMVCRGARYHHDGEQYGGAAFCNLFLSEDKGLDVHFALANRRMALKRGTAMIFDTCQPHAVIRREAEGFDAAGFPPDHDLVQIFLTWELSLEDARLVRALQLDFDVADTQTVEQEQVRLNGRPVTVCPGSGRWIEATA